MPASQASLIFAVFILWLFIRDARRRGNISLACWIPVLWVVIVGSRPLSLWFNGGGAESGNDYQEGNPLDRIIFLGLIVGALVVIIRRRVDFQAFLTQNRALCCLCVFWCLSAIWAESPFVAFKRWIKDMGHVMMILVILSEKDPLEAIKAVFARAVYLLVPVSVLFIKWYPALGSYFNRWTGGSFYQGVTTNKNQLGVTLTVCTLFLVWDFLEMRRRDSRATKIDLMSSGLLMLMAAWLFRRANSATSLACTMFGVMALVAFNLPVFRKLRAQLIGYTIGGAIALMIVSSVFDLGSVGAGMLGRDASLHGRTEIWSMVMAEKSNPLFGAGFYSFWSEARVNRFAQVYSFGLTQAHNGYLETYLNGGIIGLGLLLVTVFSGIKTIQQRLIDNPDWGCVSLVFWLIILAHNWSEASFNKLSLLWFVFLLVAIRYKRVAQAALTTLQRSAERAEPNLLLKPRPFRSI